MLDNSAGGASESIYLLKTTKSQLTEAELDFVASWPDEIREEIDGIRILMVHGSPTDPVFGYVYPDTDLSTFEGVSDYVFMGNTHRAMRKRFGNTTFVNVGSCGLPRDDGRFGSVTIFDTKSRNITISRFNIEIESKMALEKYQAVHVSVRDVFSRRLPRKGLEKND